MTIESTHLFKANVEEGAFDLLAVYSCGVGWTHAPEATIGVDAGASVVAGVYGTLVDVHGAVRACEALPLTDGP